MKTTTKTNKAAIELLATIDHYLDHGRDKEGDAVMMVNYDYIKEEVEALRAEIRKEQLK